MSIIATPCTTSTSMYEVRCRHPANPPSHLVLACSAHATVSTTVGSRADVRRRRGASPPPTPPPTSPLPQPPIRPSLGVSAPPPQPAPQPKRQMVDWANKVWDLDELNRRAGHEIELKSRDMLYTLRGGCLLPGVVQSVSAMGTHAVSGRRIRYTPRAPKLATRMLDALRPKKRLADSPEYDWCLSFKHRSRA